MFFANNNNNKKRKREKKKKMKVNNNNIGLTTFEVTTSADKCNRRMQWPCSIVCSDYDTFINGSAQSSIGKLN